MVAFILALVLVAVVVAILLDRGGSSKQDAPKNLAKNGNFETPKVAAGGFSSWSSGQAFPGWTVVGKGSVSIVSESYASEGLRFPAHKGHQWLDLTGDGSNSAAGVSQQIVTEKGTDYTLKFSVGNQNDPRGIYGTRSSVTVYVNGARLMVATNAIDNESKIQVWKVFTHRFAATGTSTTIRFISGDGPTDNTNGLDTVSVRQATG